MPSSSTKRVVPILPANFLAPSIICKGNPIHGRPKSIDKKQGFAQYFLIFFDAHGLLFYFMGMECMEPIGRPCFFLKAHMFLLFNKLSDFIIDSILVVWRRTWGGGQTCTPGFSFENNAAMICPTFFCFDGPFKKNVRIFVASILRRCFFFALMIGFSFIKSDITFLCTKKRTEKQTNRQTNFRPYCVAKVCHFGTTKPFPAAT